MKNTRNIPNAIVITGASSGIGEACALHLDKLGFIVFAGVRKEIDGLKLKAKASNNLVPIVMDITNIQSIITGMEYVAKTVSKNGIQGLINNAGMGYASPIELIPISDLRQQMEVNVIGQVAVIQKFLPLLRLGKGRIVNIGSVSGLLAEPILGPYSASKHAMEALTDSLRMELRPWKISVSMIEAGSVLTPIWEKSLGNSRKYLENLSVEEHQLYDETLQAFFEIAERIAKTGIPPQVVANAVTKALTSKRPKTRYVLGPDAKIKSIFIKPLPDWIRDLLIVKVMALPKKIEFPIP